jgi:hypothetical protein
MTTENEQLTQRVERLTRELCEYIRAEEVLIAAGLVRKEKVEQAHEIVRGFTDA